jgi:hypothetical protein
MSWQGLDFGSGLNQFAQILRDAHLQRRKEEQFRQQMEAQYTEPWLEGDFFPEEEMMMQAMQQQSMQQAPMQQPMMPPSVMPEELDDGLTWDPRYRQGHMNTTDRPKTGGPSAVPSPVPGQVFDPGGSFENNVTPGMGGGPATSMNQMDDGREPAFATPRDSAREARNVVGLVDDGVVGEAARMAGQARAGQQRVPSEDVFQREIDRIVQEAEKRGLVKNGRVHKSVANHIRQLRMQQLKQQSDTKDPLFDRLVMGLISQQGQNQRQEKAIAARGQRQTRTPPVSAKEKLEQQHVGRLRAILLDPLSVTKGAAFEGMSELEYRRKLNSDLEESFKKLDDLESQRLGTSQSSSPQSSQPYRQGGSIIYNGKKLTDSQYKQLRKINKSLPEL